MKKIKNITKILSKNILITIIKKKIYLFLDVYCLLKNILLIFLQNPSFFLRRNPSFLQNLQLLVFVYYLQFF